MREKRSREERRAPFLPVLVTAVLLASLGLATSPQAAGLQQSAWPMFNKNASHTAQTFDPIPLTPEVGWSALLSDSVDYSSPVIAMDGTVYVGDLGKDLWAFDAAGNPKWNFHAGGNFRRSSPAIAEDGTVYIGCADGNLYAINPDGSQRWASLLGGPVKTSPAVAGDGSIYVGADDGRLYSLNPDGTQRWSFATGDTVRSSPVVMADTLVVFGSNDGLIYAVRTDGSLSWAAATGGPVKAAPALGQGNDIIIGSYDGFLYSIRHHGALHWAIFTGENIRTTPSIGIHGKIYMGIDNDVFAYHDEGDTSWVQTTGGRVLSSAAIHTELSDSTETVIVGSDDGNLYALSQGNVVWTFPVGSAVRSSPAIGSDGTIYFGATDGKLYALKEDAPSDAAEGAPLIGPRITVGPNPGPVGTPVTIRLAGTTGSHGPVTEGEIGIFDSGGRLLQSLSLAAENTVIWDGRDHRGRLLSAGVYLYRWSGGGFKDSGRLVRIR